MYASQMGMTVASNNIANAQNPEYTRQRLVTAPMPSYGGNINLGMGIDVIRVVSLRDQLIEARRLQENSARAGADLMNRTLSDIEVQFTDTNNTGLLQNLANFFNSFQTLSTDPASTNFREQVRISTESLMNNFKTLRDSLVNSNRLINMTITEQVNKINSLGSQIARISGEIASAEAIGVQAGELRDQRLALVKQLSAVTDVREQEASGLDRTYQLSVGDGRPLVVGTHTFSLSAVLDTNGNVRIMSSGVDITNSFNTGEAAAAIDFRDNYIPKYLNSVDQLAYEIVQQVNSRHSAGYDLNGNTGIDFFQSLASATGAAGLMALSTQVAGSASSIAASSQSTGQDNDVAMQIGSLLFQPVFSGGSASDQYRSLVFEVGTDVASSEVSVREHTALMHQLDMRRQQMSGVSMDEETVSVLQFQRAYQASAKLIKTVDELTQVLLNLT